MGWKETDGVVITIYYEKLWKTKKKRKMNDPRTRDEFGSQLHMVKVLAAHNACPKIVPLIKWAKSNVVY